MLIDGNGTFMTQRVFPKMALFKLTLEPDKFIIRHRTHSIALPFNSAPSGNLIETKIWDDTVITREVGTTYNQWFSAALEMDCKLVYFPENNPRPVDSRYKVNNDHVSLADGYPFLIIGQESLHDLNSRLEENLPMNRFRPNFVFTGGTAYEEDTWRHFKIGNNGFIGVKPSSRCVLTTINQDTGKKGVEPLKTLANYRKRNNKIYFGQNVIALDYGQISVGESITLN